MHFEQFAHWFWSKRCNDFDKICAKHFSFGLPYKYTFLSKGFPLFGSKVLSFSGQRLRKYQCAFELFFWPFDGFKITPATKKKGGLLVILDDVNQPPKATKSPHLLWACPRIWNGETIRAAARKLNIFFIINRNLFYHQCPENAPAKIHHAKRPHSSARRMRLGCKITKT